MMKPNDKAFKEFMRVYNKTHVSLEAQIMASLTAAYAAQFPPSEDYAELIERLRFRAGIYKDTTDDRAAADALEAVLAERDDFAEQIALRSENGISKDLQEFLRKFKEDDSAAIRMFAQYRDLEIEMDSWKSLWEKTNAHMRQVEAERDALAARLAPVDDEELVEIVTNAISKFFNEMPNTLRGGQARVAIAAIRPHIEAAERERCAKTCRELDKRAEEAGVSYPSGHVCALEIMKSPQQSGGVNE